MIRSVDTWWFLFAEIGLIGLVVRWLFESRQ